jgi:hypothetical protein
MIDVPSLWNNPMVMLSKATATAEAADSVTGTRSVRTPIVKLYL